MRQFSSKRNIQILAYVLQQAGLQHLVISPGSRNAPIAIHFSESDFLCYSIVDERAAGFVALGMAKSTQKPVALSCTSGSAAVNYYPAIVEAFYQNVPLLVLTADRPEDLVDHFDGQTIRQKDLFRQHAYGSFQLKEEDDEYNLQVVQQAYETCLAKSGPVHINIPLSEPLYEFVNTLPDFPKLVFKKQEEEPFELPSRMIATWNTSQRILILLGTLAPSKELNLLLEQLAKNHTVVVLTENNSNQYHAKFFNHIDRYIFDFTPEDFKHYAPDLLISVGQNVVSKKVKQFLRKAQPQNHWHIDPYWQPDTYFALTEAVAVAHEDFFIALVKKVKLEPRPYYNLWQNLREKKDNQHEDFIQNIAYSDLHVFKALEGKIPERYKIHCSNSSTIRYAQLFEFSKNHEVYCNRGTSGIDGCTSTAMGFAMMAEAPTLLITGDLAFFYDINGLWNKYIPPYTRIIIINNGEGNIFRIIPGPSKANALEDYIATKHQKNAVDLAKHFNFDYVSVSRGDELYRVLESFFNPTTKPKILEIHTENCKNELILKNYFDTLREA